MFRTNSFFAAPALVLLMGGTAHAALTADQVWQSWKDGATMGDVAITAATESNSGGVLTLNGVSIAPKGADAVFSISDMTLTEENDGSVTIRPGATIGLDTTPSGNNAMKIGVQHDGLTITAREDGDALVYDFNANMLNVNFDAAIEGYAFDADKPAPITKTTGEISLQGLNGSYSDAAGANRTFGLDLAATEFSYDFISDDPGMESKSSGTSQTADFAMGVDVTLPTSISMTELESSAGFQQALQEGFAVAATFSQGVTNGSSKEENQFFPFDMTMSSQPGKGTVVFNKDLFSMQSVGSGMQFNMNTASLPTPIEISMAEFSVNYVLPMLATAPADFTVQTKISQLVLNDGVWGLFDPSAVLQREPFDLNIDVTGKSTMDVMGLIVASETGGNPPIPAPEAVNINDISLKVAGAALDAVGAFTFDNSMGVPMPLGEATVNVSGANALIDGLIKIGLVQEQDAMGVRMMMGMFMVPGADADSLTTKIEAKEGFSILVNGQPLPM
ncbi:MAG: DUF2125 domain-containing protein [Paracoccaceae bacterium]